MRHLPPANYVSDFVWHCATCELSGNATNAGTGIVYILLGKHREHAFCVTFTAVRYKRPTVAHTR